MVARKGAREAAEKDSVGLSIRGRLAGEGLQPSSKGAKVKFDKGKRTVIDGPFASILDAEEKCRAQHRPM
jgi:hypothetical protein